MKYQKIVNLLDTTPNKVPRFITKKWIEVCDQSGTGENRYKPNKQTKFKTSMLRDNPAFCDNSPTGATFRITMLYVPVVTLSAENDNKLLEQLKTRFKRTIKWNKYRSEVPNQTKNNSLDYVNRLFVL